MHVKLFYRISHVQYSTEQFINVAMFHTSSIHVRLSINARVFHTNYSHVLLYVNATMFHNGHDHVLLHTKFSQLQTQSHDLISTDFIMCLLACSIYLK